MRGVGRPLRRALGQRQQSEDDGVGPLVVDHPRLLGRQLRAEQGLQTVSRVSEPAVTLAPVEGRVSGLRRPTTFGGMVTGIRVVALHSLAAV